MSPRIVLIDNYDSFVFNLARYVEELGAAPDVIRNDAITVRQIRDNPPDAIILSPGPCTPVESGICLELIQELGAVIPMLGVCLGHQAIAAALGGNVIRAPEPVHGRTSFIQHDQAGLFAGCPLPLRVTRYHSLIVERGSLPDCLHVTAETDDGILMGLSHRDWPVHGVQFHPESILTERGHQILQNFFHLAGLPVNSETRNTEIVSGDLPVEESASEDFFQRAIDAGTSRLM